MKLVDGRQVINREPAALSPASIFSMIPPKP
jgi:hypothetical protein